MVYLPEKHPKEYMILISIVIFLSIVGRMFVHEVFIFFGLCFWILYTAVLSYHQFKTKKKYKFDNFTHIILHPQLRFFIFVLLASYGLFHALIGSVYITYTILIAWWLFSLNFYIYYVHGGK
ncbi:MAG: hypothetical protein ABIJ08_02460 [Nanoarchaeota archaeon]